MCRALDTDVDRVIAGAILADLSKWLRGLRGPV